MTKFTCEAVDALIDRLAEGGYSLGITGYDELSIKEVIHIKEIVNLLIDEMEIENAKK